MTENTDQKQQVKPRKTYSAETVKVMSVAFELGFIIALPILALALAGKWLDQKEHVGYYLYVGIALAIILTSFWIYARFKEMVDKLEQAAKLDKEKKEEHNK